MEPFETESGASACPPQADEGRSRVVATIVGQMDTELPGWLKQAYVAAS
jgi:hypothetical protein